MFHSKSRNLRNFSFSLPLWVKNCTQCKKTLKNCISLSLDFRAAFFCMREQTKQYSTRRFLKKVWKMSLSGLPWIISPWKTVREFHVGFYSYRSESEIFYRLIYADSFFKQYTGKKRLHSFLNNLNVLIHMKDTPWTYFRTNSCALEISLQYGVYVFIVLLNILEFPTKPQYVRMSKEKCICFKPICFSPFAFQ